MMRFAIVIPARNGERFLGAAIESALAQSRPADEVLVIDDNSTDCTAEIARSNKWNGRVGYRHHAAPSGFAEAWNRAAAFSSSEFVTILHQDDLLDGDYLANVQHALTRYPKAQHVYSACRYIDADGREIRSAPRPHDEEPRLWNGMEYAHRYLDGVLSNQHIHRCPGVTTFRALLQNKCSYRKEAGHIADDDFFYRVGAYTDVVGIAKPLASYREHKHSITGSTRTLELTLAGDWLFQVREFKRGATLFDANDGVRIVKQAVKLATRALVGALRNRSDEQVSACVKIIEELDAVAPEARSSMATVARPLWALCRKRRKSGGLAAGYLTLISVARGGR
jgi:glycosyltransferase involved in cell wall biosynthesis